MAHRAAKGGRQPVLVSPEDCDTVRPERALGCQGRVWLPPAATQAAGK